MLKAEVDPKGLANVSGKLQTLAAPSARLDFFTRLGAQVLRWVDQNMRSSGGRVGGWRPLAPLTLFGRRLGHGVPLETLRSTFTSQPTDEDVRVGTSRRVAKYHQSGTGTYAGGQKYPILPRFKKALAFPAPAGYGGGSFSRERAYGTARKGMASKSGNTQTFAVVRGVMHPGVAVRRMLPNAQEGSVIAQAVAKAWVAQIKKASAVDVLKDKLGVDDSEKDEVKE